VDETLLQAPENFWQVRVNSGEPSEPPVLKTAPAGQITVIVNISAKSDKFKDFKCRVSETGRNLYYHIDFSWPYLFARGLPRPIAFNPGNIFRLEILGSKGNKCDSIDKCECTYVGYYNSAP